MDLRRQLASNQSWRPRWFAALLLALLAAHFATRWQQGRALPLGARHLYARNYALALSLVAGHGFQDFPVGDTPGTRAVDAFLKLERPGLTRDEVDRCFREPCPASQDAYYKFFDMLATTRVLDLRLAALLWSCFGISWNVLFVFYALVSTACCAMILAIARRLSGSDWAGVAAAVLFLASPLESYNGAWSIRDASPAWFAIGCGWLLVCVVDRPRNQWANGSSQTALGVAATLGMGWRLDALLWLPFFGAGMLVLMVVRRRGWRRMVMAAGLLVAGSLATRGLIAALSPAAVMPPGIGFHMAYYADSTRSNLAGLENSFQVVRCDAQTVFAARTLADRRTEGRGEPVEYLTPRYSGICRELFLAQAQYHAYDWVRAFPSFFWRCLSGLSSAETFFGAPRSELDGYRFAWLHPVYRRLLDPLTACLPWFAMIGVFAATLRYEERWSACWVALFSLFYTPALWLVLPESKHLTPLVLPLAVFGGIGLAAIAKLARASAWQPASLRSTGRVLAAWGGAGAIALVVWIAALGAARPISARERQAYLDEIVETARSGVDAGELLRGDAAFSWQLEPGAQSGWQGYLLTIVTDDVPGELVCRHVRYPRDWLWTTNMATRHRLHANRRQYFFVSALQGGQYGDPRPYRLAVRVGQHAHIEACTRVDLKHWQRLPVSTVFLADDHQAGSPQASADNSTFLQGVPAALPSTMFDPVARRRVLMAMPWQPTPRPATGTCAIDHLLGRDRATGTWRLAVNHGQSCLGQVIAELDPGRFGSDSQTGDFNGDGAADVIGWDRTSGALHVALFNGTQFECKRWANWPARSEGELLVGDFNGDGLDDALAADRQHNCWRVALSRGNRFDLHCWGPCNGNSKLRRTVVGDLNADGRADLAQQSESNGRMLVWRSTGGGFDAEDWGAWSPIEPGCRLHGGDFNGDGRTDLATRDTRTGSWSVALAAAGRFEFRDFGPGAPDKNCSDVQVGDFNGDGLDDLAWCNLKANRPYVALSKGHTLVNYTLPVVPAEIEQLVAGDFNGDGRADLAGSVASSGVIWIGCYEGSTFRWQSYGGWLSPAGMERVRAVNFWKMARSPGQFPVTAAARPGRNKK